MSDDLVTGGNWKRLVKAAIEELPEDVLHSVGWGESSGGVVEISVAVAPEDRLRSTMVRRICLERVAADHPHIRIGKKGAPLPGEPVFHLDFADAEKFKRHIQKAILDLMCRGGMIDQKLDKETIRYISKSDGATILELPQRG